MADTVTSQTIQDGERVAIMKFTNVSDGAGESAVKKVDVSALANSSQGKACTSVKVAKIWWACRGMGVNIEFDASTNVLITGLPSDSLVMNITLMFSGIPNNAGSGKAGDIDFTTVGHSSGDTYSIILELVKDYE